MTKEKASPPLLYEQACLLAAHGQTDAAKEAYLKILGDDPVHLGALNNLGALLVKTGYKSAAKTVYTQAIAHHPNDAKAQVNLGNILLEENDLAAARRYYEAVLDADAAQAEAHQGLARIFAADRDAARAAFHAEKGFRGHAVSVQPYTGQGKPVELLLLVAAMGGNIPLRHHLDDRIFKVTAVFADFYDGESLPPHDFVFNAIGDADFCAEALAGAEKLLTKTTAKVLNPPAAVRQTGRVETAARAAAIDGVRTAATRLLKKEQAREAAHQFPLLLRAPGFHTGQHFIKIDEQKNLTAALDALPGEDVFVMEYLDARGGDGICRKYRVMTIGGTLYPLHMAASPDWKVHYFTAAMEDARFQAEEKAFLENMQEALGEKAVATLGRLAAALELDYGGIDFGLDAAGDILLFEANATMIIPLPPTDAPPSCRRALTRAAAAVQNMLKQCIKEA